MKENENDRSGRIYAISNEQDFGSKETALNQSSNYLVQISSRATLFQKHSFYKKVVVILAVSVIVLLIAILIILTLYIYSINFNESMCTTDECLRSAANLKLSMNLSVDPCEDFYHFTCGKWSYEHPNHGWFSHYSSFETADERIALATVKFLTSNESEKEPLPVKQSRYLYKSCMDTDSADKIGLTVINNYLTSIGLPLFPHYFEKENDQTPKFDWIQTEVNIRKTFAMDSMVGFIVDANIYNRNESVIYLGRPETGSQLPTYLKGKKNNVINIVKFDDDTDDDDDEYSYEKEALKTIVKIEIKEMLENVSAEAFTNEDLENAAETIWEIKSALDDLQEHNYTEEENLDYQAFNVNELQKVTEKCVADNKKDSVKNVWRNYLTKMFEDIENESFDLNGKTYIYVSLLEVDYLCNILNLISNTSDTSLELFYWWAVVDSMIISTTSDVAELIWKATSSTHSDSIARPRSIECASLVVSYMGVAVSYGITDLEFLNTTAPKVNRMIKNIKDAFVGRVNEITWMDRQTKIATLEKSREMVSLIGFPEWFLEDGGIEQYYGNITIGKDTYLENMMSLIKTYTPYMLSQLGKVSQRKWRTDPTTVNAYNYFSDNSITVPMAILTFPFYNLGLEVLNYGAIGSILGHELTHGFDITGRKFDKYGNYKQWWSNGTIVTFEEKTNCFIKQYNNFTIPPLTVKINGQKTLSENLADNGGVHHAFLAYKATEYDHRILPGFENFTPDQMFFIAFGSIWCEEYNSEMIKNQIILDEHSPSYARVTATLQNSEHFAHAFNCPLGSNMNPKEEKCRIW